MRLLIVVLLLTACGGDAPAHRDRTDVDYRCINGWAYAVFINSLAPIFDRDGRPMSCVIWKETHR